MVYRPSQWLYLEPKYGGLGGEGEWSRVETPHSTQVHTANGIDLRWFGTLHFPSWDFQRHPLITKGDFLSGDNRAYQFACAYHDQTLSLTLSGQAGGISTVAIPDISDGRFIGLRATWRNSDGRIQFFYSFDNGETWTQLGANLTGGTGTIPNRGDVYIGRDFYTAFTSHWGKTARAEIRNAPGGTIIASPNFTDPNEWTVGDTQADFANDAQGNTWTIVKDKGTLANDGVLPVAEITDSQDAQYLELNQGANTTDQASAAHNSDAFNGFTRMDILALIRPDQISSGTAQTILTRRRNGDSGTHISFTILADGKLFAQFRDGSGTIRSATSDSSLDTVYSDRDWFWVRAEMRPDGDLDVIRFHIADASANLDGDPIDPSHWISRRPNTVLFGNPISISGADGVEDSDQPFIVGQDSSFSGFGFKGKINQVEIQGQTSSLGAQIQFGKNTPWVVGDDSSSGSKLDIKGRSAITLVNSAQIQEQFVKWFSTEQGNFVLGSNTQESIDLQGDATGGLIFGTAFSANPRIVGEAKGDLIFGARFPQTFILKSQGGLVISSNFDIIPPEVVAGVGSVWSVGIAGHGFLLSTLDQEAPFEFRSYEIQAIPQQRPQIDDQDEPGEQTLFPWWSRAQHSWHEGAGQEIFDSPFSSRFKYCHGHGIDPWREGELKLLKDTAELRSENVSDHHLLGTPDALFYTVNGVVHRDADPDTAGTDALSTHSGTPINSITSDGESLFAAFSGGSLGIKKTPLVGTLAWTDVNVQTAVERIAFVKGRLIGAKGPSLYEYDLAVTTEPIAFHTDRASTWKWTGIAESGPAIYFSGHAGDRSEIFAARLTAQDIPFASISTLGAMRSVWQAPEGETIRSIKGYLGKQVLIGTSKGVRVGTVSTGEGDLEVTGLITEVRSDHPMAVDVLDFEPQEDYAWFTWSSYDSTRSGLGRIHLGTLAWASDLLYPVDGEVKEVVTYKDRRYFAVKEASNSHLVKEHATDLVETAQLSLCLIRFGTTESKVLRYLDVRGEGGGGYSVQIGSDGETPNPLINSNPLRAETEHVVNLEGGRFKIIMDIERASSPTQQFILREWRLRSEPRSKGRFRYLVPLMIYDHMTNLANQEIGHVGYAFELLQILEEVYRSGRDTLFQRLGTNVPQGPTPTLVIMEDLRFKSFTPPSGSKGFGGIALAVLREVR